MASADELILQMQHLVAQAKETRAANTSRTGLERLKSSAQKLAYEKQTEVDTLEQTVSGAEQRLEELRQEERLAQALSGEAKQEFVALSRLIDDSQKKLVKARAQLNFALDRMEVLERAEYESAQAELRAEVHAEMAKGSV